MRPGAGTGRYDVVVVGGGHNGLVSAAYLAGAGLSVLVLERLGSTGGAATSRQLFRGLPARISAYSYLVGLFPDRIVQELGLGIELRSRRIASYSPTVRGGHHTGLLVERRPGPQTAASFRALTGSEREYAAWRRFYEEVERFCQVVAPSLLEPLPLASELHRAMPGRTWAMLVEEPLGTTVEERLTDDLVRGVVATDALIGTFADLHDPGLEQNRCFLYHLVGNGSGEWRVPVGGMGALSAALESAAVGAGAEILTDAEVTRVATDGRVGEVSFRCGGAERTVAATWVLANVAPSTLDGLLGAEPAAPPEGAQLKVNMLLDRLPRLRSGVPPEDAFAGTLHVAEGYRQLQEAYREAADGLLPRTPPGELYCHSLTDPTILGPLAAQGRHSLTYFGLHAPARLFAGDVEATRNEAVRRVLATIDSFLEEPLESLLSRDADGAPCLHATAPQELEAALGLPGGHIFHGPLSWPWSTDDDGSLAARWGVGTRWPNVLLCGAGAVRGGAVSGIGGQNAAMAVLESGRTRRSAGPAVNRR